MAKRVVIVGANFAGFTAALELGKQLGRAHDIVVISKWPYFLFTPSLVWLPFGERKREEITFPLAPIFAARGIDFVQCQVERIDLDARSVVHERGIVSYDYLILATGPVNDWDAVPGLGPHGGFTHSIFGLADAERTATAFEHFVADPGPVVIGGVQGASGFGAAYEFLFNFAYQMRKRKLRDRVPITYVTAEPFLGHLGVGGFGNVRSLLSLFFDHEEVTSVTGAAVGEVRAHDIVLTDGRKLPHRFAMLAPPLYGAPPVRALSAITDARGFVVVNDRYQTGPYPEVYAAGAAVAVDAPTQLAVPCGVPKTGYLSEEMAKIVVHNIVADLYGAPPIALAPGAIEAKAILDAGNNGIIMVGDHFLEPRMYTWLLPGPEAHWAKIAFEKMFLATHRRGWA